jgi:hypothetical protein
LGIFNLSILTYLPLRWIPDDILRSSQGTCSAVVQGDELYGYIEALMQVDDPIATVSPNVLAIPLSSSLSRVGLVLDAEGAGDSGIGGFGVH